MRGRIEALDYMRGLMALSVMTYHYTGSAFGTLGGETVLGKLGIYAVSVFYILSGLSLAIVYAGKIAALPDVGRFWIKRVFRIFPLFWLAVTAELLLNAAGNLADGGQWGVSVYRVFLNYSLLFGFVDPSAYLPTGAWSIGNEMVFYVFLPLVFLASRRFKLAVPLTAAFSLLCGLYFAFGALQPQVALADQWAAYINPFNQFFLFMAGVVIGVYGRPSTHNRQRALYLALALVCALLFAVFPAHGDKAEIASGLPRVVLSTLCILGVMFVYFANPAIKSFPARILAFFGEGCYSIYLLHPLVAAPFLFVSLRLGLGKPGWIFLIAAAATLTVSWLTFRFLEAPMMGVGKRIGTRQAT